MFIAYVVRLAPGPLANGELVGFVEEVDTGVRSPFHGLQELGTLIGNPGAPQAPNAVPPRTTEG